jgi:hypothetical protein
MRLSAPLLLCIALLSILLINVPLIDSALAADTRIAVLDFELKDLTPLPNTPQELERTASVAPLLRRMLADKPHLVIVDIDAAAQTAADKGAGYLFDRPETAAELGAAADADYIVVGRLHKPSFLFAYLKAHLVDVKKKILVGDFVVEVKGAAEKVTAKGVESLAGKIYLTLDIDDK